MPAGKSKEETWKTSDFDKELRGAKDDKAKRSTKKLDDREVKDKRHRTDDRESRHNRDDRASGSKEQDRRHRDEVDARDHDRDKRRREEAEGGRDRERKHRTEGEIRERDREQRKHDDDGNREKTKSSSKHHSESQGGGDRPRRRRDGDTDDPKERKHRSKEELEMKDSSHREKDRERTDRHRNRDQPSDDKPHHRVREEERRDQRTNDDKVREHRQEKDRERRDRNVDGDEKHRRKDDERKTRDQDDKRKTRDRSDNEIGASTEKKDRARNENRSKSNDQHSAKKADDDNYGDYEDDFEAYEDDFDVASSSSSENEGHRVKQSTKASKQHASNAVAGSSTGNKEMSEILRAMSEENERLLSGNRSSSSRRLSSSDSTRTASPPHGSLHGAVAQPRTSVIDFVSAKRRNLTSKAVGRLQGRASDLAGIIECESVAHSFFEHLPMKEYDSFIKNFGQSNSTQVYIQTNDDNIDRDVQTEDVICHDKWTQHPPGVDVMAYGGDISNENKENSDKLVDSVALGKFLEKAIRVMAVLLEENLLESLNKKIGHKQSNIVISDAFIELNTMSILEGRHCTFSQFSAIHSQLLLAIYNSPAEISSALPFGGVICVWNVYEPQLPQKVLVSRLQPQCCCFSPNKPTLVFAGMVDGSIVVWDLRESSASHYLYKDDKNKEFLLQQPTYNTAGVLHHNNHQSPVVAITPVVAGAASTRSSVDGDAVNTDCLAFQLASLEMDSVVNLWVVAEFGQSDVAGSLSDLGLRPGGRIKLIKSSTIILENPLRDRVVQSKFRSFDMQLLPQNHNHFFVTTDTGCVIHGLRHGGKALPKSYRTETDLAVEVTTLDFSPFSEPVFLVGCADGSLRLFHIDSDMPLMTWPQATEAGCLISLVRWCRSRPSVFFVLDANSFLYIWDLNMDDSAAVKCEQISKRSRVTSLCLSNDNSATGQGLPGRTPQMVVFLENGTAEAHLIKREFSALMGDEIDKFALLLQTMV